MQSPGWQIAVRIWYTHRTTDMNVVCMTMYIYIHNDHNVSFCLMSIRIDIYIHIYIIPFITISVV